MSRGKKNNTLVASQQAGGNAARFSARKNTSTNADYGGLDANLIREAIETVTAHGGAIRFGYTSDGGAYAIGIYDGDNRFTEYFRSDDEVSNYLRDIGSTE